MTDFGWHYAPGSFAGRTPPWELPDAEEDEMDEPLPQLTRGFKGFTTDLRSPVQGTRIFKHNQPWYGGALPFELPQTGIDLSPDHLCSFGWNYCPTAADVVGICGLAPDGFPLRIFEIEYDGTEVLHVTPNNDDAYRKARAEQLTLVRELSRAELDAALEAQARSCPECAAKTEGQIGAYIELAQRWHRALARPRNSLAAVTAALRQTLAFRGLSNWSTVNFTSDERLNQALSAWNTVVSVARKRQIRDRWHGDGPIQGEPIIDCVHLSKLFYLYGTNNYVIDEEYRFAAAWAEAVFREGEFYDAPADPFYLTTHLVDAYEHGLLRLEVCFDDVTGEPYLGYTMWNGTRMGGTA